MMKRHSGSSQRLAVEQLSPLEQATQDDSQLSFRSERDFPLSNPKVLSISAKKKHRPRMAPKKSPLLSASCTKTPRFHDSSDEDNSPVLDNKKTDANQNRKLSRGQIAVRSSLIGSVSKRKKSPRKKQTPEFCFSEDSSSDEDEVQVVDGDSDMEIPYAQAYDAGIPRAISNRAAEPLRAGDVIAYYNPVFVAGNPMGFRIAQVLKITGDVNYPLELSNGECLGSDCYIRRIREYYKGELYPHEGLRRAIENFSYTAGDVLPAERAVFEDHLERIERVFEEGRRAAAEGPPEESGDSSSSSDEDDEGSRSHTQSQRLPSKPRTQKQSSLHSPCKISPVDFELKDSQSSVDGELGTKTPRKTRKFGKAYEAKARKEATSPTSPKRRDSVSKSVFSPDSPESPLRKPIAKPKSKLQKEPAPSSRKKGIPNSESTKTSSSKSSLALTKRNAKTKGQAKESRPPRPQSKLSRKGKKFEDSDDDEIPPSVLRVQERASVTAPSPSESQRRAKNSRLTVCAYMGNSPEDDDDDGVESVQKQQQNEFRQLVGSSISHTAKNWSQPSALAPSASKMVSSKRKEHSFGSSDEESSAYYTKKQKKAEERKRQRTAITSPLVTATNSSSRPSTDADSLKDKHQQFSQETISSSGSFMDKVNQKKGIRRKGKKRSKRLGLELETVKSPAERYS